VSTRVDAADLSPSLDHLSQAQRVALWVDVMNACEQLLLAALRREIGPDGDLRAAYRKWYAKRMAEHDEMMLRMLEKLGRVDAEHGNEAFPGEEPPAEKD
jgi:hypothetical protein